MHRFRLPATLPAPHATAWISPTATLLAVGLWLIATATAVSGEEHSAAQQQPAALQQPPAQQPATPAQSTPPTQPARHPPAVAPLTIDRWLELGPGDLPLPALAEDDDKHKVGEGELLANPPLDTKDLWPRAMQRVV
jgi:hypothetical protein